jgi:hypothetical protein
MFLLTNQVFISRLMAGYIKLNLIIKKMKSKLLQRNHLMNGLLLLLASKAGMIAFSVGFFKQLSKHRKLLSSNTQNLHFVLWLGGANFNFYRGSTTIELQVLRRQKHFMMVWTFHCTAFRVSPDSRWGVMLQAGYDSRKGDFDQVITVTVLLIYQLT